MSSRCRSFTPLTRRSVPMKCEELKNNSLVVASMETETVCRLPKVYFTHTHTHKHTQFSNRADVDLKTCLAMSLSEHLKAQHVSSYRH